MPIYELTDEEEQLVLKRRGDLQALQWKPTLKENISARTKADAFDVIYTFVCSNVSALRQQGEWPKDFDHYLYETVMVALFDDGIWEIFNQIRRAAEKKR